MLCLVFVNALLGKVTGFGTVAGVIAAKGLPLAPLLGMHTKGVGAELREARVRLRMVPEVEALLAG